MTEHIHIIIETKTKMLVLTVIEHNARRSRQCNKTIKKNKRNIDEKVKTKTKKPIPMCR